MKALSIKQPWAWLICAGYKDVENRSWMTNFRGRIYVHASKSLDGYGYNGLLSFPTPLGKNREKLREAYIEGLLAYGAVIGEVDIVNCQYRFGDENDNLYSEWHAVGNYGLILANPVLYDTPIPWEGCWGSSSRI